MITIKRPFEMPFMKVITFDRFARSLFTIAIFVLLYLLINKLSKVLTPFFVAWLVAYLLYPIVCFFQYRCKLKYRLAAISVTLILLVGLLYLAGVLIVPSFINEYKQMEGIIKEFMHRIKESLLFRTVIYAFRFLFIPVGLVVGLFLGLG